MANLYNRKTELHVYSGGVRTIIKGDNDGLDLDFDVEAFAGEGPKSSPNVAKINVYNLRPGKRNLFGEEHQAVELYAGYGDDIGLIFLGETTNVVNTYERNQQRWVTTIYAGDGIKDWSTRYFNRSYSKGTLVSQVLQDMADATGLPSTIDTLDIDTLLRGETFSGLVKDVLTDFCEDRGLDWSIQWGVVEITQRDSPLIKDASVEVLRADTGMIESPVLIETTTQKKKKGSGKKKRKFGVRVLSLLNHRIRPKRLVRIESENQVNGIGNLTDEQAPRKDVNGTYIVQKARYFGSVFGQDFYVEIEANLQ